MNFLQIKREGQILFLPVFMVNPIQEMKKTPNLSYIYLLTSAAEITNKNPPNVNYTYGVTNCPTLTPPSTISNPVQSCGNIFMQIINNTGATLDNFTMIITGKSWPTCLSEDQNVPLYMYGIKGISGVNITTDFNSPVSTSNLSTSLTTTIGNKSGAQPFKSSDNPQSSPSATNDNNTQFQLFFTNWSACTNPSSRTQCNNKFQYEWAVSFSYDYDGSNTTSLPSEYTLTC
jgi:hypothetical protein